jgi:hypothetical protein
MTSRYAITAPSRKSRDVRNMAMVRKGSELFSPEEVARRERNRTRVGRDLNDVMRDRAVS